MFLWTILLFVIGNVYGRFFKILFTPKGRKYCLNLVKFRKGLVYKCCIFWNILGAFDPCQDGNFNFLHTPGLRGGKCKLQRNKVICDHYMDDGWYKVLHEDDLKPRKMLVGIVSSDYCGTSSPIWLNGEYSHCHSFIFFIFFRHVYGLSVKSDFQKLFWIGRYDLLAN